MAEVGIEIRVNGRLRRATVEPRLTLVDFLRERCQLTGTHVGCEHGACGACTVLLKTSDENASVPGMPDGQAVRACLVFAVQAAFREHHGLQCGFRTPGFVISVTALLRDHPDPTDGQVRDALSGNLCRCTGYQGILAAVRAAADSMPPTTAQVQETR